MKKLIGLALTLAVVLTLGLVPAIPVSANPGSIVGLWHFENNADDSSGKGNNGTVYGATYVDNTGSPLPAGKALGFDGTSAYVDVGTKLNDDLPATPATLEVWLKGSFANGNQIVLGHYASRIGLGFYVSGGHNYFIVKVGTSSADGKPMFDVTGVWVNDVWNHIAVTYDASTNPTFWLNGTQITTTGVNQYWTWTVDQMLIGKRSTGTFFKGLIDEVRIWDEALPAARLGDITPPTVTITVSDATISDADAAGTLDVIATFDEAMDTSATPTISFDANIETSGTLTFSSGAWSAGDTVYTAIYDVADVGETQADVDVSVGGAQDLVGNAQSPDPTIAADLIDVDTENPTGTVTVDTDPIYEGDLVQGVTVTYDEAMDPLSTPVITFTGATGVITSNLDGAWSSGNTVWTETFDVADADEETATVTVSSSGATDVAGNTEGACVTDTFAIDTKAPVVTINDPDDGAYYYVGGVPPGDYDVDDETATVEEEGWSDEEGVHTYTVTATDDAGNVGSDEVTYTVVPESKVTTSSLCCFDVDPELGGQQFRLIFTQDPINPSTYKLTASNPGQFYYNVFYIAEPEGKVHLTITIPDDFVTQGAVPVHVYSDVSIDANGCFVPSGEQTELFTVGGTFPEITVAGDVPESGLVYVTVHLDYGLKKTVGYKPGPDNDALKDSTVVIENLTAYEFGVTGGVEDSQTIENENVFKKNPGFGGVVESTGGNLVNDHKVEIYSPTGTLLDTVRTDEDGYYFYSYKYTGKPTTYTVELPGYTGQTQSGTLKANKFVEVNFTIP